MSNTNSGKATASGSAAAEVPVKHIRVSPEARKKLEAIFEHFDRDHDERLNWTELNNLQVATNANGKGFETNAQYAFVCKLLDMAPLKGINFAALARVYLDEALPFDADLDADYEKLFGNKTKS